MTAPTSERRARRTARRGRSGGRPWWRRAGRTPRIGGDRPTWAGVRTIAGLELRRRLGSRRWQLVLLGSVATLYGLFALAWIVTATSTLGGRGVLLVGLTTCVVLALGLVVAPALTATTLSGEPGRARLATLQATRLTGTDIALGTLLAALTLTGVIVVATLPAWAVGLGAGGVDAGQVGLTVGLVVVCFVTLAAVGLACSAQFARPAAALGATYGLVALLTFGTVGAFGAVTPLTARTEPRPVTVTDPADPRRTRCVTVSQPRTETHSDLTWWLLAANPFVVVGDAAGISEAEAARRGVTSVFDPLSAVRTGVRAARLGPGPAPLVECVADDDARATAAAADIVRLDTAAPVWPGGLAALLTLTLAAVAISARLVRVPARADRRRATRPS